MPSTAVHISEPLKVWDKLTLVVGEGVHSGVYMARIEDIINGGIVITEPEFVRGQSLLRDGIDIIVQIVRKDAVYQFVSQIRRLQTPGRRTVVLTPPCEYRRVQRRMFVRIDLCKRIEYAVLSSDYAWHGWPNGLRWYESRTFDVSAGGLLIEITPDSVKNEDVLAVRIPWFDSLELPQPVAAVCRRVSVYEEKPVAGVQFILADDLNTFFPDLNVKVLPLSMRGFDSRAQNRLSQCIFNEQIELRRKGLL